MGIESRSVLRPPNRWEEEEDDIAEEDTDSLLIAALESCCLLNLMIDTFQSFDYFSCIAS